MAGGIRPVQLAEEAKRIGQQIPLGPCRAQPVQARQQYLAQGVIIREGDVVVDTTAQEGIGEILLGIAGDEDQRPIGVGNDIDAADAAILQLLDPEEQLVDLVQQVVGEVPGCLVDLVDEDDAADGAIMLEVIREHVRDLLAGECLQQGAPECVVGDVVRVVGAAF